jgi:hypothetical protein
MFQTWQEAYEPYLRELFDIFENRFKDKIDIDISSWNSKEFYDKFYDDFCNFVYSTSSGYISPYLEQCQNDIILNHPREE